MSYSFSFFARDVHAARRKLDEVHAPAGVKALVELALAGIGPRPLQSAGATQAGSSRDAAEKTLAETRANQPTPRVPQLAGIHVESHGHIDEYGQGSGIGTLKVQPFYD